jgi:hypothetical protein
VLIRSHSASVIDHILMGKRDSDVFVAFYFPRFDDQLSLMAETAIKSIVRQVLEPRNLSKETEVRLKKVDLSSGLDELLELLRIKIAQLKRLYIIIDGLDEFQKPERDDLFKALSSLASYGSNLRLFLASRESLSAELRKIFPSLEHISMGCQLAQSDIELYIEGIIQEKLKNQDLTVGDPGLVAEIKEALVKGADGM